MPEVPEFDDPDWLPIVVREFDIAIAAQEMAENNVDYSHFQYVHGTDGIPEDEFVAEGTYKRAVGQDGNFVREGYGLGPRRAPGQGLGHVPVVDHADRRGARARALDLHRAPAPTATTPCVERGRLVLRRAEPGHPHLGEQDLPPAPGAHPSRERPILEHRRWARQFYSAYDEDIPTTTEDDE